MRPSAELTAQRSFITVALCAYAAWNLFWLLAKKVPVSLFSFVTGYPCPTTGGVRALRFLWHGDWRHSFLCNPFTLIFLVLMGMSAIFVLRAFASKKEILLPHWLGMSWLVALGLAWCAKFAIGPEYW